MSRQKTPESDLNRKLYTRWYAMIDRCTNSNHPRFVQYGGSGVTVCQQWLSKDNFIEDAKKLPGFSIEGILTGGLHLDKDTVVPGSKIYSPETCVFIERSENNKIKPNQMKPFIAISPTGETFKVTNQSKFAEENNLRQTTISDCLSGRIKKHRGWSFRHEE